MKNKLFYGLLLLVLGVYVENCGCKRSPELNNGQSCVISIKHAGSRMNNTFGNLKEESYYVYGFSRSDTCYKQLLSFIDSLEIDPTMNHIITFLAYDKSLPLPKSDAEALFNNKFSRFYILEYSSSLSPLTNKITRELIYFEDGEIVNEVRFNLIERRK